MESLALSEVERVDDISYHDVVTGGDWGAATTGPVARLAARQTLFLRNQNASIVSGL